MNCIRVFLLEKVLTRCVVFHLGLVNITVPLLGAIFSPPLDLQACHFLLQWATTGMCSLMCAIVSQLLER